MSEVIVITSGKGGVGKTTTSANIGTGLAMLGRRVALIDTDIGLRNLDLVLGMSDKAVMDFSDVMAYRCSLLSAAVEQPEIKGLYLLTAPLAPDGLDIQRFSQTAPGSSAQFFLLDFQVDQSFQFIFRRTASVFGEYGYHSNCSAAGNLDTFHPDLLVVVWLIYGRKPPFLTVSPIMIFIL